jgi:hypothetical protein
MGAQSSRLSREGVMNLPKLEMFGWAVLVLSWRTGAASDTADRLKITQPRHRQLIPSTMTEVHFDESMLSTLEGKVAIITGNSCHSI